MQSDGKRQNKRYNLAQIVVMLVDDNDFMRGLILRMCQSFGISQILQASSGPEALEMLQAKKVDMIICDWAMAPMDGVDFARQVRTAESSPDPFAPIIMLTAHTEYEHVTRARDAGVHEFLAKPVSPQALLDRIIHIIEHPRDFIRFGGYFGPDRRRTKRPHNGPERRFEVSGRIAAEDKRLTRTEVADALDNTRTASRGARQ